MPRPSHSSRFYHPPNSGWRVRIIMLRIYNNHCDQTGRRGEVRIVLFNDAVIF
jgi:hypothetical protein